ncbi:MAG: ABC transporter ATP-binding protein [Clostridiales bacterium]|nr:ABC transporter ATP-binding protein [Clostridiales bacterium]
MKDTVIDVRDVTIEYRGINAVGYRTFIKNLIKKNKKDSNSFTAVKNVSFDVKKGETVGIVGENGSGKSTLLGAIAGIYGVDGGAIRVNSEKCSLLALGTGFQSRLSGYQNIFLSGYAMGFSKAEVNNAVNEIIEFSELGDFINKPVKTYSSGMYSKLAFAISSILTTEVLLIDETLSVGDMRFKEKSYAKMEEMINDEDRSVVIVNHSTESLRKMCDRVLWLHKGETRMFGDTDEVLNAYRKFMVG